MSFNLVNKDKSLADVKSLSGLVESYKDAKIHDEVCRR